MFYVFSRLASKGLKITLYRVCQVWTRGQSWFLVKFYVSIRGSSSTAHCGTYNHMQRSYKRPMHIKILIPRHHATLETEIPPWLHGFSSNVHKINFCAIKLNHSI